MYKITGKLQKIGAVQNVSDKFQKREFVIVTDEKYPQSIQLEFTQNNVVMLDNFQLGQNVEVTFSLRGREWKSDSGTKYFNTLNAFGIKDVSAPVQKSDKHWSGLNGEMAQDHVDQGFNSMLEDDLPF